MKRHIVAHRRARKSNDLNQQQCRQVHRLEPDAHLCGARAHQRQSASTRIRSPAPLRPSQTAYINHCDRQFALQDRLQRCHERARVHIDPMRHKRPDYHRTIGSRKPQQLMQERRSVWIASGGVGAGRQQQVQHSRLPLATAAFSGVQPTLSNTSNIAPATISARSTAGLLKWRQHGTPFFSPSPGSHSRPLQPRPVSESVCHQATQSLQGESMIRRQRPHWRPPQSADRAAQRCSARPRSDTRSSTVLVDCIQVNARGDQRIDSVRARRTDRRVQRVGAVRFRTSGKQQRDDIPGAVGTRKHQWCITFFRRRIDVDAERVDQSRHELAVAQTRPHSGTLCSHNPTTESQQAHQDSTAQRMNVADPSCTCSTARISGVSPLALTQSIFAPASTRILTTRALNSRMRARW
jgi:hypothetical protein